MAPTLFVSCVDTSGFVQGGCTSRRKWRRGAAPPNLLIS
jgi:hypothetical protein